MSPQLATARQEGSRSRPTQENNHTSLLFPRKVLHRKYSTNKGQVCRGAVFSPGQVLDFPE